MKSSGILLAILITVSPVFGDILIVPDNYPTIQAAIDAAVALDTIIVNPGTYYEHLDMGGKAVTLTGTDPNDPAVVAQTIIDGSSTGRVITCDSGETSETVISGFWIQNGEAGSANAGGIYCYSSYPVIRHCVFSGNAANAYGGAIFCYLGGPTITNCTFIGNEASNYGGGVACYQSTTAVSNCVFSGNDGYRGGGIASYDDDAIITNCTFSGNTSNFGGAVYCSIGSPIVLSSILWGNTAVHGQEIRVESLSNPAVSYSVIEGGWAGLNNSAADPLFIDADGLDDIPGTADDDLHLDPFSGCINAGDPIGDYTAQVDMDFVSRVRYGRVDIGADEAYHMGWDLTLDDENEQINVEDLLLFAEMWMIEVDLSDFALFSEQWLYGAP